MFVELLKDFLGKKAGERIHVAEAEGRQLIATGVARAVSDDPIAPLVTKAMESALAFTPRTRHRHHRDAETVRQAQGLARKHAVPAIFGAGGDGDPRKSSATGCWPAPATTAATSKSTTAPASSPGRPRRRWPSRPASPAATPCRRSFSSSS